MPSFQTSLLTLPKSLWVKTREIDALVQLRSKTPLKKKPLHTGQFIFKCLVKKFWECFKFQESFFKQYASVCFSKVIIILHLSRKPSNFSAKSNRSFIRKKTNLTSHSVPNKFVFTKSGAPVYCTKHISRHTIILLKFDIYSLGQHCVQLFYDAHF